MSARLSAAGPGLLAAGALSAAVFASRLPPGPDFILPRRGGYWLFRAAWAALSSPGGRLVFSALVALSLLAAAAWLLRGLWRAARGRRPGGAAAWAGLALGPLFAAALAWRVWSGSQDLLQLVWFPWASLDAREPFVGFALAALALGAGSAAALAWAEGRRRTATRLLLALVAADVAASGAARLYGVGERAEAPAAGRTAYALLVTGPEGPDREGYVLSPGAFGPDPRPAYYRLLSKPRSARTLPALRALYEAEAMRWDEQGLRRSLLLGSALGDALARAMLLAHLQSARPSPEALGALGALADEDVHRVGPAGAARIARAYARLGDARAARAWAAKAAIPEGLLGLEAAGAARGRITGRVSGPSPLRVALYRRPDAAAPYLLDASGFTAAVEPDARGRFAFEGVPAGRYYLAFAFPAPPEGLAETPRVSGHRGDILLDARQPSAALPALVLRARAAGASPTARSSKASPPRAR